MKLSRSAWQPVLAWLYIGLLIASWWWNTKWLILILGLLFIAWLSIKASKQTILIMGAIGVVFLSAYYLPQVSDISAFTLFRLAFTVLVWGQIATLLTMLIVRWSSVPQPGQTNQPKTQKQPLP